MRSENCVQHFPSIPYKCMCSYAWMRWSIWMYWCLYGSLLDRFCRRSRRLRGLVGRKSKTKVPGMRGEHSLQQSTDSLQFTPSIQHANLYHFGVSFASLKTLLKFYKKNDEQWMNSHMKIKRRQVYCATSAIERKNRIYRCSSVKSIWRHKPMKKSWILFNNKHWGIHKSMNSFIEMYKIHMESVQSVNNLKNIVYFWRLHHKVLNPIGLTGFFKISAKQ